MTQDEAKEIYELLKVLKAYAEEDKIYNTFVRAFKEKTIKRGNQEYLTGSFNLGGTVSGRLSSSGPNLQQLPSTGTRLAKPVKQCFVAPEGWWMVGADFSSLEDRISALQTKDPNKLKVYTDGFDGHCLRAQSYFSDQMPDIDPTDVESVNSISKKYPKLRQESKTPTFALTYQGTFKTLMQNSGFSEEEAKKIEQRYHELYKVSDQWVDEQLYQASLTGSVKLAFGLKLRTPVLKQSVYKSKKNFNKEGHKEAKTAGNALTQSYGLLNTRATNAFMQKVWSSAYRYDIKPIAQIHDATYFLIRSDIYILKWVNDNLIEEMQWCELPEIQHPEVGLEAELCLYYPSWAEEIKIPNNVTVQQIEDILNENNVIY